MGYETEYEILFGNCCRKLCKTEEMNAIEFDEYTEGHCEDCPIGELEKYYERKIEKYDNLISNIQKLIKTK